MTNAEERPPTDDVPEADLAEQQIDATAEDEGVDPARLENAGDTDADPADLLEQAISVPLQDDYDR
ncbi:hypothetical protein KV112_03165 [Mycolicibacter sp. MYC123]|uniref:Uncharacterized protein n=2 Tax=[Mycobacterium] zoologicum TaxID=2872311 RepID=A0ABU5YG19_9MYCO|nr:hypothetical protein [Mycolicibacter sp. MYC123]